MKLAVVPGVGHAPELNEPEAIAAIDEFLPPMSLASTSLHGGRRDIPHQKRAAPAEPPFHFSLLKTKLT